MLGVIIFISFFPQFVDAPGIIFVALMKQHVLGDHLYAFQWVGVFWNVISVFLVGGTAILNESIVEDDETASSKGSQALLGVFLVMLGALVQAMQFVFEEKVMTMVRSFYSIAKIFC